MSVIDFDPTNSAYKSNILLRPAGTQYPYSKKEIEEIAKCKNDPIYFIENYVKVVHPDKGLVNMKLYDYQKEMVISYWKQRKTIALTARQMGKSTTIAAFFCWYTIFNEEKSCAILANKASTAREILSRYQKAYENLPKFLQQGVNSWNKGSVELENGSSIIAASTSSSAIRGYTINYLFLDEFAFVQRNIAEEFFTSVWPTISSGKKSQIAICSTPNGFNHFYKLWNEAEQNLNGFNPLFVHWSDHPERDEKWKEEQLKVLGEDKFDQEMNANFLGSSNTLIHSRIIKTLSADRPILHNDSLRIYKNPEPNKNYILVCDPSRGTGNDSSAFIIFDISSYPFTIAAVYSDENISPLALPTLIEKVGRKYNNAHILVEINDNGQQVADILWRDLEYENFIIFGGFSKRPQFGIRTTTSVKRAGCSMFKDLLENQKLLINDLDIIQEISNFVLTANTYKAAPGYHDDLVMCCVLLSWFVTKEEFKNITNTDYKQQLLKQNIKNIEEDLLPFGFIDDGVEMSDFDDAFWKPVEGSTWF